MSVQIHGIVNLTRDSFSDGGLFLEPDDAISQSLKLVDEGADVIDLGPASSHPDAENVSAAEEIKRLSPVVEALVQQKVAFAVDSFQKETQQFAAEAGAVALNDIQAFPNPQALPWLSEHPRLTLIAMHSVQRVGIASRTSQGVDGPPSARSIVAFFQERFLQLEAIGVDRNRIWLDPGMGFFLGADPAISLQILAEIPTLLAFHHQVYISVSRKSFLQKTAGCSVDDVGAPTLTAELFAIRQGARAVRTHDVGALRRALAVQDALSAIDAS